MSSNPLLTDLTCERQKGGRIILYITEIKGKYLLQQLQLIANYSTQRA